MGGALAAWARPPRAPADGFGDRHEVALWALRSRGPRRCGHRAPRGAASWLPPARARLRLCHRMDAVRRPAPGAPAMPRPAAAREHLSLLGLVPSDGAA